MKDENRTSSDQSGAGSQPADSQATERFYPRTALLDVWSNQNWTQGVQVDQLEMLDRIFVQTAKSLYELTVIDPSTGEVIARGGNYFPKAATARVAGSSLGGSYLKHRGIYVGFQMELVKGTETILTGLVQKIDVHRVFRTPK
jgi:hypothetical protein